MLVKGLASFFFTKFRMEGWKGGWFDSLSCYIVSDKLGNNFTKHYFYQNVVISRERERVILRCGTITAGAKLNVLYGQRGLLA